MFMDLCFGQLRKLLNPPSGNIHCGFGKHEREEICGFIFGSFLHLAFVQLLKKNFL